MDHIQRLLTSDIVSSLLSIHPNDIGKATDFEPPHSWLSWWNWVQDQDDPAGDDDQCHWLRLSECFNSESTHHAHRGIPQELCDLIRGIKSLQLPRRPIELDNNASDIIFDDRGMSPKKVHEVSQMVAYIAKLLDDLKIDRKRVRLVDIGAGQGYLTRTLKSYLQTTHVLALDSDQWQTRGSQVWEERVARALRASGNDKPSTPISHKTIHITPDTLIPAVDDWVHETLDRIDDDPDPVLFLALHACGSLTPDILRACVNSAHRKNATWRMAGAVVVGCCYNLIKPTDFPLSKALQSLSVPPSHLAALRLPPSAFNLATQIPSQWLMSPKATSSVSLSIRKVVWRALLGRELIKTDAFGEETRKLLEFESKNSDSVIASSQTENASPPPSRRQDTFCAPPLGTGSGKETGIGIGTSRTLRLLGRLPDSAYTEWGTFLAAASQKLEIDLSASATDKRDLLLERRLGVLHVLRCLIGPLIESLIILDRVQWLKEEWEIDGMEASTDKDEPRDPLADTIPEKQGSSARVEAINLFDQATGSGRNVAITIMPAPQSHV